MHRQAAVDGNRRRRAREDEWMQIEGVEGPQPARPSPKLPVHDLDVYERYGGHTLRRHVDIAPDDVLRRIVECGEAAAGRFIDRETAQRCLETAIRRRNDEIQAWLRGSDRRAPHVFDEDMGRVVGHMLTWNDVRRGRRAPYPVSAVRVVLRTCAALPGGYLPITEYPVRARKRAR